MLAIHYLKRNEIDNDKWNACVQLAPNGLIYGYTFYLDALCTAWDAIVVEDYSAVMPLPWRKKWGIYYLYQPFAIAQLGAFGLNITSALLYEVLKNIPAKFQYIDVPLNFGNLFDIPDFGLYKRQNYVLPLHQQYDIIKAKYRPHIRRNIKNGISKNCIVEKNIDIAIVNTLAQNHKANWGTGTDYTHFENLYKTLAERNKAITYAVKSATGVVLASAAFFFSHKRAYYILPGNQPNGRLFGASHLLLDQFICDHAMQDLVLDFEGSDVPGLQFFYSSFGSIAEPYAAIRHNRLPWFIKWLK